MSSWRGARPLGRQPRASRVARAAAAGIVATAPMTLVMIALHRRLPRDEQYPLPPRLITDEITAEVQRTTGLAAPLPERARLGLTLAGHFAYGGAAGALYGLAPRAAGVDPALRGALFGLAVWTGSYLGWLPALGVLRPATEHPPRRSGLMIAAHLVWGSATAILTDGVALRRGSSRRFRALQLSR